MSIRSRLIVSFLAVIVLLSAGFFFTTHIFIGGKMTQRNIAASRERLQSFALTNYQLTESILVDAGERLAGTKAYGAAFELAFLLRNQSSPYDYSALSTNRIYRRVATEYITVNSNVIGYMHVFDTNGLSVWHPNPAVEGNRYQDSITEFPRLGELCRQSFTQQITRGYYTFIDRNTKKDQDKFMVAVQVVNTPFIAAATINVKDFYLHVLGGIREIEQKEIADLQRGIGIIAERSEYTILVISLASLAVLGVVCFIVALLLARSISAPLVSLQQGVQNLGAGDLSTKVPESGPPEIAALARSFNLLETQLHLYMENLKRETAVREVFENEVKITRDIQLSLIPRTFPPFPDRKEFNLHAVLQPAKQVAGDFYDFFFFDDDTLVFIVGDVSGKSVPAAFFMAVTRTLLRSACHQFSEPAQVLTMANRILAENNDACMFVTLFLAFYTVKTGNMRFANAGHNPAFLLEQNRTPVSFGLCKDPPLGIIEEYDYHSDTITLDPGKTVMLYTDGVTEAHSPDGDLYGEDRLQKFLENQSPLPLDSMCAALLDELDVFQDSAAFDDITLLLLHRNQADESPAHSDGTN